MYLHTRPAELPEHGSRQREGNTAKRTSPCSGAHGKQGAAKYAW